MDARQEELRRRLGALGFDEVGFARAGAVAPGGFDQWLAGGFHADMAWLARGAGKRQDPRLVLPGVRSIIALGASYSEDHGPSTMDRGPGTRDRDPATGDGRRGTGDDGPRQGEGGGRPVWARYALYEDYHDTFKPALVAAGRLLEELYRVDGRGYRYYVDTGPVLERGWAERAGLGFRGRNAMLISRRSGNWLLLGAILTVVELEPDPPLAGPRRPAPAPDRTGLWCGKCTRCMDACPTQAIPVPGQVDARRCIAYQTIENRGLIPRGLRPGIGAHVFGCDVCLEVCPWNRFARAGRRMLLAARPALAELGLRALLELTPASFAETFRGTPVKRLKLAGLLRNACVGAGNLAAGAGAAHELVIPLAALAAHASPVVRAHAVWAVFRVAGRAAGADRLAAARAREQDPAVLAEYAAAEGGSDAT